MCAVLVPPQGISPGHSTGPTCRNPWLTAQAGTSFTLNGLSDFIMKLKQVVKNFSRILKTFRQTQRSLSFVCGLVFPTVVLAIPQAPVTKPLVVALQAGVTAAEIQKALDSLPSDGGEVILPPGKIEVSQPIVLQRDYQILRGAGQETILFLADNANCPVIIMGEPVNRPKQTSHLRVGDLLIDGNRLHQQRELWRLQGEGSEIRNNGITVQNVSDSIVENVTCARCRSGGLVTTLGTRRLTVCDLDSYDNQFDGLACFLTVDCLFTNLYLHDNPGAGISLDGDFNHNIIDDARLAANDLGIFMRWSHDNQFHDISIHNSRDYGVFMAQAEAFTAHGWQRAPQTGCTKNSFTDFIADECGSAAFRVNDISCTNNIIIGAQFRDDLHGDLSLVQPILLTVESPAALAGN